MVVVIDTCIIGDDFHLRGTSIRLLLEQIGTNGTLLVVPEVVVRETVNRFREAAEQRCSKLISAAKNVTDLVGRAFEISYTEQDLAGEVAAYNGELRSTLAARHARILAIPQVPHESLISRDLERRKPFGLSGKGYRDALIWESVLALAAEHSQIVILSSNTNDFAMDGRLHPDLSADLVGLGMTEGCVRLVTSLRDFVSKFIIPILPEPHQRLAHFLQEKLKTFSFEETVGNLLTERLPETRILNWQIRKPPEIEDPTVTAVYQLDKPNVIDERETQTERLVEFSADVECLFDCYVDRSEYYDIARREGLIIDDDNWNERCVTAQFYSTLHVTGYLLFDSQSGNLVASDITEITAVKDNPKKGTAISADESI